MENSIILIIDDSIDSIRLLISMLQNKDEMIILYTTNGHEGIKLAMEKHPDLILLDADMPEIDGFEVCRRLKREILTKDSPVIFVTAYTDASKEVEALETGAVDFITKPLNPAVVNARVKTQLTLKRQSDVLSKFAIQDALTGIFNRRYFNEQLNTEWDRHQRQGVNLALILIDIDHFKRFNDNYGHLEGDACLKKVAEVIAAVTRRSGETVSRYGGEEFAVILPNSTLMDAKKYGELILNEVRKQKIPHAFSPTGNIVTISVGVGAILPTKLSSIQSLIQSTDQALYHAKTSGRNKVAVASLENSGEKKIDIKSTSFLRENALDKKSFGKKTIDTFESVKNKLEQVQSEHNLFETIFNLSPIALLLINQSGVIVKANLQSHALYRYPGQSLVKQSIEILLPELLKELQSKKTSVVQDHHSTFHLTESIKLFSSSRFDGSKFFASLGLNSVMLNNELSTIVSIQDVTLQKDSEAGLYHAKEQAEIANRFKSEFVANMSHELLTPMNAMLGIAYLLSTTELSNNQKKYVEMILDSGRSLLGTLKDMFDFSKIEEGLMSLTLMEFQLNDLLSEISALVALGIKEKDINLQINIDQSVPLRLVGDPLRLKQILINLVSNAVKFTEHGIISISVSEASRLNDEINLRFQIRDTGIGIPIDMQPKLFSAFTQVDASNKRQYGGAGLGLVIAKRLVELMDGGIGLSSEPDKGSEFWFIISLKVCADQTLKLVKVNSRRNNTALELQLNGIRILLSEDKKLNQIVAKGMLENSGASVDITNNGKETVALLKDKPDFYHIVLMDLQMPVMDGYMATRLIRQQLNLSIPIIAMTAMSIETERIKAIKAGMNDFIQKPIEMNEMIDVICRNLSDDIVIVPQTKKMKSNSDIFSPDALWLMTKDNPNDRSAVLDCIKDLIKKDLKPIDEARQALKEGRVADAKRIFHNMQGILGTLGAKRLVVAAKKIESQIIKDPTQVDESFYVDVTNELGDVISAAYVWLAENTQ